jgi:hypothetical protein
MFGRLTCGLVLVMTALPGAPGNPLSPPRRLRSSSPIRGCKPLAPISFRPIVWSFDRFIVAAPEIDAD